MLQNNGLQSPVRKLGFVRQKATVGRKRLILWAMMDFGMVCHSFYKIVQAFGDYEQNNRLSSDTCRIDQNKD